ncbi:putative phage abortive infection protein [Qipengyuania citrea]|uniref:putative phage abortive infection protein n=1 Tax=Qipengyuania citrea TaxID=225971 RepID=UPI00329846B8
MKSRTPKWSLFVAVFVFWFGALWLVTKPKFQELASELPKPSLEKLALLGDTFGTLSALMAAFAAVGAILALSEQRSAVRRQMFVATFVGMMERLQSTVQDTDFFVVRRTAVGGNLFEERLEAAYSGQAAFYEFSQELRLSIIDNLLAEMSEDAKAGLLIITYNGFYEKYIDRLGHYFRQIYHIVKYIDENGDDEKERFVKILRSTMTNSQLLLLAYNLIAGEGRVKFRKYAAEYSLLHNLGFETDPLGPLEKQLIDDRLGASALVSISQQAERADPAFQKNELKNSFDKEALRRFLIEAGYSTDLGVSWKNPQ